MSLFPAYSLNTSKKELEDVDNDLKWLNNSSFQSSSKVSEKSAIEIKNTNPSISNTHEKLQRKRLKTNKKKEIQYSKNKSENTRDDDYCIETKADKSLLTVSYLKRTDVPQFYRLKQSLGRLQLTKLKNKTKTRRYFSQKLIQSEDVIKKPDLPEKLQDIGNTKDAIENQWSGSKLEQDLTQTTAFYNRGLAECPSNVSMWLNYVNFQDIIWQFEKSYRRGSLAKGIRVTAERKLAILDKALSHNPECEELLRERLRIAESVYPADELSELLHKLVDKDPGNIILWQGYIETIQCSMAHCNTPAVIEMYNKCLFRLHQFRRSCTTNKNLMEGKILNMLYQCGLFLRQAGLWEQLWTLLKLYLELNFSPEDKQVFNIKSSLNDKQLVELEETILASQLPSHELWLRIEKLRESCHWLPCTEEDDCGDPQRLVFIDDVSELIHPITASENTFRLVAITMTLLKIPLLPCRHTTMNRLGLDYVPWGLDIVEMLLPTYFPISTVNNSNSNLIKNICNFAVGPQYLKSHPGQEEYLNFIIKVFKNCASSLKNDDRLALYVWWFYFERLLIILDNEQIITLPLDHKKKLKTSIRELLKLEINRNNVIFYREYALIEFELNHFENACNILIKAMSLVDQSIPLYDIANLFVRASHCSLYKTLVEILIKNKSDNYIKAINILASLALGGVCTLSDVKISDDKINEALMKFQFITTNICNENQVGLNVTEHFLPNFFADWIICQGWMLYLTKSIWETSTFIEDILNNHTRHDFFISEILFEWYVAILHRYCCEKKGSGNYNIIYQVVERALKEFPNNLYFLATVAQLENIEGCITRPRWKLQDLLLDSNHALPALFLILLAKQRMLKIETALENSAKEQGGPVLEDINSKNRMMNLFRKLTQTTRVSKRCGLVWRLYLQFLYQRSTPETCRNTYYVACEECPWLKALYIDAAIYIPAELPQIQDLLIEKQLRIHVTPEELEILRN